jgi:hypothetical protein
MNYKRLFPDWMAALVTPSRDHPFHFRLRILAPTTAVSDFISAHLVVYILV